MSELARDGLSLCLNLNPRHKTCEVEPGEPTLLGSISPRHKVNEVVSDKTAL